ncbi:MAG: ComF family protein [Candidatus Magasanikbacteria bacterium]|nr:ComF family protein [Candidatus Magasanikbacteria bacterium]MCA9389153.1 ComF family protein [Candidatus Magasanikbacteria bacterium]MCA9390894.1 ComF family protein [Candidatus Magasanikbacteria bacterium]USN52922.1 MAG: ComF family protein [Candidatus Nomurabacteria bacterium]HPF95138.1 phosphoribosyltransferase family protein [bacterium]
MGDWLCSKCQNEIEEVQQLPEIPAGLDGIIACYAYSDPKVRILTASYKYRSATVLEDIQANLLKNWVHKYSLPLWAYDTSAVLVPIVSPESRTRSRGIRHTSNLANTFKKAFELPSAVSEYLGRHEHRYHNADLTHEERSTNVKNTFFIEGKLPEKIILIDDVVTTGSTLSEAAQLLKEHGTKEVYALVFARG